MSQTYYNCLHCMNKKVRVLTRDGRVYEGTIVNVDRENVYLKREAAGEVKTSAFFGPFAAREQILTLSLFTLLAIALI